MLGSIGTSSLHGGSLRGRSPNQDRPRGPPPDPPIGFYGWQTPNPRIFMPPWYQLIPIRFEPTNKLPY
jgi:hypothetical protein